MIKYLFNQSLGKTLDAVNEAYFFGGTIPKSERVNVAKWIANRQGLPNSYANMFAPTEKDLKEGAVLFTGEKIGSNVGTRHILGEEACRALILLDIPSAEVNKALKLASEGIRQKLSEHWTDGIYCCGSCTVALWRHLTVGKLENSENYIDQGIKVLKKHRDGKGRWRRFPFYYTLLVLNELEDKYANEEIHYASKACERLLKRKTKENNISQRRKVLLQKVLEKIS